MNVFTADKPTRRKILIAYKGPSELDGEEIVVILTESRNRKTGPMIQTWIMRADENPWETSKAGADSSICGECPHRWSLGGGCYVNLRTVNQIWQAYNRGSYETEKHYRKWYKILGGIHKYMVRLGSYGDPAAVPREVWDNLIKGAKGHTGYTHQWRKPQGQAILDLCMASADSSEDAALLRAAGARYFQVIPQDAPKPEGSIECLADAKGLTCSECGICDGLRIDRILKEQRQPISVHIRAHGARSKRLKVVQ